jgi:hypothetical protein
MTDKPDFLATKADFVTATEAGESMTLPPPSDQTLDEFRAIHIMLKKATSEGLLDEVVWQFGHAMVSNGGLVKRSAAEAGYEWDIA